MLQEKNSIKLFLTVWTNFTISAVAMAFLYAVVGLRVILANVWIKKSLSRYGLAILQQFVSRTAQYQNKYELNELLIKIYYLTLYCVQMQLR